MTTPDQSDFRRLTLEAIHDHAIDAIITIDESGIIESVNPATELMFGFQPHELIGANVQLLMPSPYREEHDQYLKNYLDTGIAKIIGIGREVIGQRKDQSLFPIHVAVSEINIGQRRLFTGIIRDLTAFKRLEEQQTTLGRIIEDSFNEVYIFDGETLKFILVNRGARQNLGYNIQELRELTPIDIKPGFDEADFKQLIEPLVSGQLEKLHFETVHQRKDGSKYEVDVFLHMSKYLEHPVFVAIILDVTERRLAQRLIEDQQAEMQVELETMVESRTRELHQAQTELVHNEKFSTLGKISGGIAHEIRNPLNAIKTSAYFLLNAKQPTADKVTEHLERIDRQVSLIDNVVTALADVAKLPESVLKPVDLKAVLRAAVDSIGLPPNIHVEFRLPDGLPKAMADDRQIVIAIKNLIRNAREAMPEGGILTIDAEALDDEKIAFTIADTGRGIKPEQMGKILEPLYTTKARGMGLGLSISLAIVEKNKGAMTVESELGKGSRFTIQLRRER